MARPRIQLDNGRWNLWRLTDDEFVSLGHHALPVVQNHALLARLQGGPLGDHEPLWLGQTLVAMERRFGPSSPTFDDYRGSYSFPLLLTFDRGRRCSYLLRFHDYRGMIHIPFYRVVTGDPSERERSSYHPPIAEEFSQQEMDDLTETLCVDLKRTALGLKDELLSGFYRSVPSDVLLYGFDGTRFFEFSCASWQHFEDARLDLEMQFGAGRRRTASDRVEHVIDRVTQG